MVLALTTPARVRQAAGIADSSSDATDILTDLIAAVSQDAQDLLGRWLDVGRRTEVISVSANKRYVNLRGFPITQVTSVKYSSTRSFTEVDALDPSTYDVVAQQGQIYLRPTAFGAYFVPGWLEVQYSGGMAADTDAFKAAYPRIEMAVRMEVANRYLRREHPEGDIKAFEAGVVHAKELASLDDWKEALGPHRSFRL